MKKLSLILLALMAFGPMAWAQQPTFQLVNSGSKPSEVTVTITDLGWESTTTMLPSKTNSNYSSTQQIYTVNEIGGKGQIKSIAFKGDKNCTRELVIYMTDSSKGFFSSTSDYYTSGTQVFSGSVTFTANEWTTIPLAGNGFTFNRDNLVVIVDDNTGSHSSVTYWQSFYPSSNGSQALCFYDETNIDPFSPNASNSQFVGSKNQIQLAIVPSGLSAPSLFEPSNISAFGATVSWMAYPYSYLVCYHYQYGPTGGSMSEWFTTTAASVDLTDLMSSTEYTFNVYAEYRLGNSEVRSTTFTTEAGCDPARNLTVSEINSMGANLTWDATNSATSWEYITVAHGDTPDWTSENVITTSSSTNVPANIYACTGQPAQPDTDYDFYVRANCSEDEFSEVAMLTFHTTECAITTFPVTYGFETSEGFPYYASAPTTNPFGDCWRNETTVSTGNYLDQYLWGTSRFYKHNGEQALVLPDKGNDNNPAKTMLVFPEMNFTNTHSFMLSFWIYRDESNSQPDGFNVYASDCNNIGSNAVLLGRYSSSTRHPYPETVSSSGWYQYEIGPVTMTGPIYLIFEGLCYSGRPTYVDDIVIKEVVPVTAYQIVSTVTDPSTEMTWNEFAQHVNNGHIFLYDIELMENISINTMVGTEENPFIGTFNGNGYTLSVSIQSNEAGAAPFRYISGATIKNLKVTGSVVETNTTEGGYHTGGLVGFAWSGTNTIENCLVSTDITITTLGGGIVAHAKSSTLNLTGCVYDGDITNTTPANDPNRGVGGLVGWCDNPILNITDCIYNGSNGVIGSSNPDYAGVQFHPVACKTGEYNVTAILSDCYYFCDEPEAEYDEIKNIVTTDARKANKVTGTGGVSVDMANEQPISYSCSGIYGYEGAWTGIKAYNNVYGGDGKTLNLTLSGAPGYVANHGTLEANGGSYALTMQAYDTEISGLSTGITKEIIAYSEGQGVTNGWYLIASPLDNAFVPSTENGFLNNTYDLYRFNQSAESEWENWKSHANNDDHYHFDLEPGKGYLYANSGNVTLMFCGTPYSGNGQVSLKKTDDAPLGEWNLIGNPFNATATIGTKPFYRMNEYRTEIIASDNPSIEAMEGIFVQATSNGETVTFTAQAKGSESGKGVALNLTQNGGTPFDRVIVRFDGGETLSKFQIRDNSTKLYIPQNGKDYAIVNAETTGEMPLNFKASENGTYTLTINVEGLDLAYLHLIDNMTGAVIDLLSNPSYSFEAKTTDYVSRFKLVFSVNDASTGSASDEAFAFISDGNIIVNGDGTLQVIDALGRLLFSKQLSTANCQLSTVNFPTGVYVLRLINGENLKIQKIIIQ